MASSIFLLLMAFSFSEARRCGRPGSPIHGSLVPQQEAYDEGDQVTYTCHNGFYSKRDTEYVQTTLRRCQCNGIWDRNIPPCNYYDILHNTSLFIQTSINQRFFVDGSDETCGTLRFSNTSTTDIESPTIRFDQNYFTVRIQLGEINLIRNGVNMSILYRLSSENWTECENFQLLKDHRHILSTCRSNRSSGIFKLKVHFALASEETGVVPTINICSLQVFTQQPNVTCGSPDLPQHGTVIVNSSSANYSCESGYSLWGNKVATCKENNGDYQWRTRKAPICVSYREKDCKILPAIQNGRLTVVGPTCFEDYNVRESYPLASLQCNAGFAQSRGNEMHCNEATNWTWQFDVSKSVSTIDGDECVSWIAIRDIQNLIVYACTGSAAGAVLITLSTVLICTKCCRRRKQNNRNEDENEERVLTVRASLTKERSRTSNISQRLGINSAEDHIYCTIYETISGRFSKSCAEPANYCALDEED